MTKNKRQPTFSFTELNGDDRLQELILYIAQQCENDPTFGATKLNKILWFSDLVSYLHSTKPITGVEYQRLRNGPAPRRLLPIRAKMEERNDIIIRRPMAYGYARHTVSALREPNLNIFSPREISIVDTFIREFWGKNATDISGISHGVAWQSVGEGKSIPYEAAFLSDAPFSEYDRLRTEELALKLGWKRSNASRDSRI